MQHFRQVFTLLALASALSGCVTASLSTAPSLGTPEYSAEDMHQISHVVQGTVVTSRLAWLPGSGDGKFMGALIGGAMAASQVREGNANTLGQIAGGAAGASIGGAIGSEVSKIQALELIVRLDDGRIKSLVQPWESKHALPPGTRVALTVNPGKKVRAIPLVQ